MELFRIAKLGAELWLWLEYHVFQGDLRSAELYPMFNVFEGGPIHPVHGIQ